MNIGCGIHGPAVCIRNAEHTGTGWNVSWGMGQGATLRENTELYRVSPPSTPKLQIERKQCGTSRMLTFNKTAPDSVQCHADQKQMEGWALFFSKRSNKRVRFM